VRARRIATMAVFLTLALLGGQALFAAGQPEDPVRRAEDLIEEGRYNEAVVVLQQVISTEPDRIDEAERLLRKVRAVRTDYNELFERLLNHLESSPEDLETTIAIIDEMEALEAHPSAQVREQIATARVVAQLAYDRDVVRRILVEAGELLQERRYVEALERYRDGFELRRDSFEEREEFDAELTTRVASLREALQERTGEVAARADAVGNAVEIAQLYPESRSAEALGETADALSEALEQVVALEEALAEAAAEAGELRAEVARQAPDAPVDWHVNFLRVLTVGSIEQRRYQGVLGASRLMLDNAIAEFRAPIEDVARRRIELGHELVAEGRYFDGLREFSFAADEFDVVVEGIVKRSGDPELNAEAELGEQLEAIADGVRAAFLDGRLQLDQAETYAEVVRAFATAEAARVLELPAGVDPGMGPDAAEPTEAAARERYNTVREGLIAAYQNLNQGRVRAAEREEAWEAVTEALELEHGWAAHATSRSVQVARDTAEQIGRYQEQLLTREGQSLVALSAYQYRDAALAFTEIFQAYERAERYLDGSEQPPGFETPGGVSAAELGQDPPPLDDLGRDDVAQLGLGDDAVEAEGAQELPERLQDELADELEDDDADAEALVLRYPSQARDLLEPYLSELDELAPRVRAYAELLGQSDDLVREQPFVELWITRTEQFAGLFDDVYARVTEILERSDQYLAESMELRAEGEQLLEQTEEAIANLEVEVAREYWEEARTRFYDALELQDDPQFRDEIDQRIVALGVEIQEARNQRIVQEVRERIQTANRLYDDEEYIAAQDELLEARRLWEETNVTENAEIERLLGLVNAALNFEDERVLTEADPLFPVLSNYLNIAQEDFERGRDLYRNDVEQEAERFLDRAERNLENVIAIRPNNWEARLLQLRIIELREGDNFAQVFERRLEDVLAERDSVDPIATLTELEVLKEINPDYPGLDDLVAELEIEAGLRPDPVTVAQERRSDELFAQAQNIAGGGLGQDRAAMQLLEEALDLNPNNSEAQALLDQVRIRTGGQATVALSSTAEQQYRRAEALFIQGNVAQAYSIVQNLMQDDANAGYPPLQRLHQRITSRLGI